MAKTNAQKQREYRERKKLKLGEAFLEKERLRQRKNYVPVATLTKEEHKQRKENNNIRLKKCRDNKKTISDTNVSANMATATNTIPLLVQMNFPKKGNASRRRKQLRQKKAASRNTENSVRG